jgi:seryl-tRNA synthetase
MLDPQYLLDHLDLVKANCANRNVTADVDRAATLQGEKKRLLKEVQSLQEKQNAQQKATGKEKDAEKKKAMIEEGRKLREQVAGLETHAEEVRLQAEGPHRPRRGA